ncbi:MAG: histidine kinase dimerization/phospho-acceptor domain-containing protein [Sporosarcina sp.]
MKKSKRMPLIIWSILVALFLTALVSIINSGPRFIGKSYVDTDDFKSELDYFYEKIGATVLNPIDVEKEKKHIKVSMEEIEEHRERYGTLADQIANITAQYQDRIEEAKAAGNEVLKTELIKEQEVKIDDIRKNFQDDKHVEAKVRAEKGEALEQYVSERFNDVDGYNFQLVAYELKDVETGETFASGDVKAPAAYKKMFNSKEGYFKAKSLRINNADLYQYTRNHTGDYIDSNLSIIGNPDRTFEGIVVISKAISREGSHAQQVIWFNKSKYIAYGTWIAGIIAFILLLTKFRFNKNWVKDRRGADWYNRLKIDVKGSLLVTTLLMLYINLLFVADYFYFYSFENLAIYAISYVFLVFLVLLTVFQLVNFMERLKDEVALKQEIKDSYSMRFILAWQGMFLNRSIGVQMFLLLIGFFLAGFGLFVVLMQPMLIIIYIPLVLFAGLPFLYIFVRRTAYLNRIIVATEAMAAGRLHEEIKVEGKSPLADHARNLNNLREGVRVSMTEQAKSERLKTELITNVSHDLRTPLTSIITYTDLLKKEDITAEERTKYVDILDKKSQRLKTLIEDLFEVSKMASGNLELHKQRVDLTQLLQQALAEHEEEISKSGLDFRVNLPESTLVAYVDGKRWWRVLDNLIVNAVKYTLPGTRVYITLRKVGDNAEFIVKNVTKYELGENTDELFERFKRADASRHTDGSGLGLAIAQSIVDLHNGNMKIEVDGDLFKVTVVVAAI